MVQFFIHISYESKFLKEQNEKQALYETIFFLTPYSSQLYSKNFAYARLSNFFYGQTVKFDFIKSFAHNKHGVIYIFRICKEKYSPLKISKKKLEAKKKT